MIESILNMPSLGEAMEEGVVNFWLVKVGQKFKRGDPIIVVETDKTAVEFPALGEGTLLEKLKNEGETVLVGEPIARIKIEDGPDWTAADDNVDSDKDKTEVQLAFQSKELQIKDIENNSKPISKNIGVHRATPVARCIARLNNIDINSINGSGRRGRVEKSDVEATLLHKDSANHHFAHNISYVSAGAKNGKPFLLIHGFSGDNATYAGLMNGLSRAGHHVVAIDLPGHGASKLEAENVEDLSVNLATFAKEVLGSQPFHLVAHSLGSVPALALAKNKSIASLTLIAPVGIGLNIDSDFILGMSKPSSAGEVKQLLKRITDRPLSLSDTAIDALYKDLKKGRLQSLAKSLASKNRQQVDIIPALEDIASKVPTRILIGHKDRIIDWPDVYFVPSNVAVHNFAHAGHMVHWDQPVETLKILLQGI